MPTDITPTEFSKVGLVDNDRTLFVDYFSQLPILKASADLNATFSNTEVEATQKANLHWEVTGTNAVAPAASTGGGMTLTTATSSADQVLVGGHTGTGGNTYLSTVDWSTDDELAFYIKLKTGAAVTLCKIFAGFKLTAEPDIATDNEQVYFSYDAATDTTWKFTTSDNGTDDTRDSGVTVSASTTYELYFEVDSDRVARAFINVDGGGWTQVAQGIAALGTGHDLLPFFGVETSTGAARAITVRKVAFGKTDND